MTTRKRRGHVCAVVGLACMAVTVPLPAAMASGAPTAAAAVPAAATAALPNTVTAPPEGKGKPFTHNPMVDKSGSLDLPDHYVEEEFLVSGTANVYETGPDGELWVKQADVPYTTRLLVRRPADPKAFSGQVHMEAGQTGLDGLPRAADHVFDNGDAWVSVLTHALSTSTQRLETADAARYEPLSIPEFGQNWDIISQVGRLLKTKTPANPLNGHKVRQVYANGWSSTASIWLTYTGEGLHDRLRMPNGRPVIDGYLLGEPSAYLPVNSTAPAVSTDDPRQKVRPLDVPVIALHTRPQEDYRRRPDGSSRNDRYRVYEVAGASHANPRAARAYDQDEDAFLAGGSFGCAYEVSRFPLDDFYQSSLARLDAWASEGVAPPPSQRIERNADGTAKLDEHGIPLGGVRSTYSDVPTARYFANTPASNIITLCSNAGAQETFSPERLTSLHGSRAEYVKQVVRAANRLERAGWLLPADAREVIREAARFDGFR